MKHYTLKRKFVQSDEESPQPEPALPSDTDEAHTSGAAAFPQDQPEADGEDCVADEAVESRRE